LYLIEKPSSLIVVVVVFSFARILPIFSSMGVHAHRTPFNQLVSIRDDDLFSYRDPASGVSFQYHGNWQDVTTIPDISIPDPTGLVPMTR
jgi:hypothetical protein